MSDDNDSIYEEEYPKRKLERRTVTQSTRRRSTLLYLEKYGLDQPNWYSSPEEEKKDEFVVESPVSIEIEEVESMNTPATSICNQPPIVQRQRPTSLRNSIQTTLSQKRPSRFIKPEKSSIISPSLQINVLTPTEFKRTQLLFDTYTNKTYMEGYIYKMNDLNSDGSICETTQHNWDLWYMELTGPVLSLWDAQKTSDQDVMPQYINIMDSTIAPLNDQASFSLNSAGANRYLFKSLNMSTLIQWILAIRLSCFECARIQEIYTKSFILRPQFNHITSIRHKSKSGYVQVRFPGTTGWKRFWAVVANHKKGILFKKPNHPRILFYDSKKAKHPTMILDKVVQAYTVYPESPKLIKLATLFKIEGALYNPHQLVSASSSALVMAADTNDLVSWLASIYDVFQLYGRPKRFLDDPKNQSALNFGDQGTENLFLDLQDVAGKVDVGISSTLLLNKKELTSILHHKLQHPFPSKAQLQPIHAEEEELTAGSIISKTETSPSPEPTEDACSVSTSSTSSTPVKKPFYAQQKSVSMNHVNQFGPTPWPMYASTGTILMKDHWEAPPRPPVHDTSMYKSPSSYYAASIGTPMTEDDEDDEDTPDSDYFPTPPNQRDRMLLERQQMLMEQQYEQPDFMYESRITQQQVYCKPSFSIDTHQLYTKKDQPRQRRWSSAVTPSNIFSNARLTSRAVFNRK